MKKEFLTQLSPKVQDFTGLEHLAALKTINHNR